MSLILLGGGPSVTPATQLRIEGTRFYEHDTLWQWRGFSLFLAYRRFLHGEPVAADLAVLRKFGFNLIRVFGPLPWKETPDYRHDNFNWGRLGEFFDRSADEGFYVEWVPVCSSYDISQQRLVTQISYDIAANHKNVLIEVANEPHVNKTNPVEILKGVNRYGVLSAYGNYVEALDGKPGWPPVLDYGTIHIPRDSAWHRRARIAQEVQHATGTPWISDEPAKITEPDFDYPGGKNDPQRTPAEMVWHAAVCALWTPGCTVHTEEGKWGRVPKPGSLQYTVLDAVQRDVWQKIDASVQLGEYNRGGNNDSPVDNAYVEGSNEVWTYTSLKPKTAVSVRCGSPAPLPRNGWTVVDRWGKDGSLVTLAR
jgi:hypothetical protein